MRIEGVATTPPLDGKDARQAMNTRTLSALLLVTAGHLTLATIAGAQDASKPSTSDRTSTTSLKLGEESAPPRADEDRATTELVALMMSQLKAQTGPTIQRDQHPKHHGCVRATFR